VRILFLTQIFDPEPTSKGLTFARELARRGHRVEVLTGFPNYPGGRVYPGHRIRLAQWEEHEGIRVLRVPLYPSHDRSALRRVASYASFALSAAALGPVLTRRPDVVYVYHPPATIGVPALVQRFLRGVPLVYDVQDLWPDTLRATGMVSSRWVLKAVEAWCGLMYGLAARIVVLSPGFRARLLERGVPPEKIDVIYNWCDETSVLRAGHGSTGDAPTRGDGAFTVVFAGTMGLAQGLDVVLDAASRLAGSLQHVRFLLIGGGVDRPRLVSRAAAMKLPNVQFLDPRPMREMGSVLASADALLVHLRDDPLFRLTIPSKTQAYLAAGKPILMGVRGDARDLVTESGAGVCFEPDDGASLAAAVTDLAGRAPAERSALGTAGRAFYERRLSLAAGTDAFERSFAAAISKAG
jgi:colanic acid biosynthesis glycosyl transferase WcaI